MELFGKALNEFMRGKEISYSSEADPQARPPRPQGTRSYPGVSSGASPSSVPGFPRPMGQWGEGSSADPRTGKPVSQRSNAPPHGEMGNGAAQGPVYAPVYDPTRQFSLQLAKPLGMVLESCAGGVGAYVKALVEGSSAQRSGQVQPGDILLTVAGRDMRSLNLDAVSDAIVGGPPLVPLVFHRPHGPVPEAVGSGALPHSEGSIGGSGHFPHEAGTNSVSLIKPLGLTLEDSRAGVHIVELQHGQSAQRSGQVHVGDVIVSVNGTDVSAWDLDQVTDFIGRSASNVTLEIQPGNTSSGSLSSRKGSGYALPGGGSTTPGRPHSFPPAGSAGARRFTVQLPKPMGTVLEDGVDGVHVSSLHPGGPAQVNGVQEGDVLIAVNGQDVTCVNLERIMGLISTTPGMVMLTLSRSASKNDTAFGGSIRGASHGARAPGRSFVHSARRAATPTRRRPTSGMLPVSGGYPQNYAMAAKVQLGGQRPSAPVVNKVVAQPMMQPAIFGAAWPRDRKSVV